jgi:hypothetical protein
LSPEEYSGNEPQRHRGRRGKRKAEVGNLGCGFWMVCPLVGNTNWELKSFHEFPDAKFTKKMGLKPPPSRGTFLDSSYMIELSIPNATT